jgi:hypothetical protein
METHHPAWTRQVSLTKISKSQASQNGVPMDNCFVGKVSLVEFQLFNWSLPKSNGPKILLSSVVPYFGFLMPITGSF